MASHRPVYLLLTGLIRNPRYQPLILRTAERAKAAGLIADYVVSTWSGEIDRYLGMRDLFHSISGLLIETTEHRSVHSIDIASYNKAFTNRWGLFVYTTVFNACRQIPADSMVYFTRLDLAFLTCDDFLRQMEALRQMDFDHNDPDCPLKRRIWAGALSHFVPFWHHDRNIFGHREDIERIWHSSIGHDTIAHGHGSFPEIRHFSNVWLPIDPLLRDLVRLDWWRISQHSAELQAAIMQQLYSHPAFAMMRAAYFETTRKYYRGFVNFPMSHAHYSRLDPVPPPGFLPVEEPANWTILPREELDDERFQSALELVRTTQAAELHRSDLYQNSFAELETGIRSVGQAVLPVVRVRRGDGTLAAEAANGAAVDYPQAETALPPAGQVSVRVFGPPRVRPQGLFEIDVVISVGEGLRLPVEHRQSRAALTHFWRRKNEAEMFGWEFARRPLRHDVVDVMIERMQIPAPHNPGEYEIVADVVFDGVCWLNAGIPFEITVEK